MPRFPFTNYHELNLDWILKKVEALFTASEENARTIRTYDTRLTRAEQTATNAETAATSAQQLADAAAATADNALSVAGTADAKADSALTAATNAAGAASGALTVAQEARQISGNAQSAAADAGALANDASNAAAAAQTTADTNAGNIATLQTTVETISGKVSDIDNKADVIISSASGITASFADGADDMPIKSIIVNIDPVQSGSGDPSPTNIRTITGHTGCNVVRTGKNLLNPNITWTNGLRDDNGNIVSSQSHFTNAMFGFKPNTTYTISGTLRVSSTDAHRIYFLKADGTWIGRTETSTSSPRTFTTPNECRAIQVQVNGALTNLNDVQIEEGSAATTFETYTAITINIIWQSESGTVYGGTLDVISGLLTVNRLAQIYNGTETWNYSPTWSTGENSNAFYIPTPLNNAKYNSVDEKYIICDRLSVKTRNELYNSDTPYDIGYSGPVYDFPLIAVRMPKTITTPAELQTWLSSNNVKIVYELETPVIYQLTPQQINTLLGSNNIYSDVGSIADVQYPADTKLYIDGKIAELQALVLEN